MARCKKYCKSNSYHVAILATGIPIKLKIIQKLQLNAASYLASPLSLKTQTMATATGVLNYGLRGKVGELIFRKLRGNTIVSPAARCPDKSNETEAQRNTRS